MGGSNSQNNVNMAIAQELSIFFKGREGDPRLGEWAKPISIEDLTGINGNANHRSIVCLGAADDTGVTLNRGRPGAKDGPVAVKSALYKFAWPRSRHLVDLKWFDVGHVQPNSAGLEATHRASFQAASIIAQKGATMIAVGGGHDFAAPHALGYFEGMRLGRQSKKQQNPTSFGLINVDPHLDVREPEDGHNHSGTPFRVVLESGVVKGPNLIQFGTREGRNARAHFDYCQKKHVPICELSDLRNKGSVLKLFEQQLRKLSKRVDAVGLTIDMDSCADIDGVSAATVIGFSAWELAQFARLAGREPQVKFIEVAEIAPSLDPTGRSARVAAEVIFHFLLGRLEL